MNDESNGNSESKDAFSLPSFGKLTVGPSGKFDQGSAYDSMNSEKTGKDKSGYPMAGGKYEKNSKVMPQPGEPGGDKRDYSDFDYDYEK